MKRTDFLGRLWRGERFIDRRLYAGDYPRTLVVRIGVIGYGLINVILGLLFCGIGLGAADVVGEYISVRPVALLIMAIVFAVFFVGALAAWKFAAKTIIEALRSN